MVEEMLQQESSYAERNAKRFKQVNESFKKEEFQTKVHIISVLMRPLDAAINKLLKRTDNLRAIRYQDSQHPHSMSELKTKCLNFFLDFASGRFGESIIANFLGQLRCQELARHCQLCSDHSIVETCFQLIVWGMSDIWWRCCLPANTFPYHMFSLALCDEPTFEEKWKEFRTMCHKCPTCMDAGFSAMLLQSVDLESLACEDRHRSIVKPLDFTKENFDKGAGNMWD